MLFRSTPAQTHPLPKLDLLNTLFVVAVVAGIFFLFLDLIVRSDRTTHSEEVLYNMVELIIKCEM